FGVHDQGDPRRGKRTPVELVQAWLYQDQGQAAEWLRETLGIEFSKLVIPTFKHGENFAGSDAWLIRNRLPEVGKGLLSGQWGTFKTFMFLNMSCSIMVGGFWTGEPVYRQGGVLLFAPEGARGINMRLIAMVENTLPNIVGSLSSLPATLAPKPVDPSRLPFE